MLRAPDNGGGTGGTPDGSGGGNGNQQSGGTPGEQQPAPTFEQWYAGLDATVKGLVDDHVTGLKTSLNTERQERGNLAKQVKDLAAKAEKGSDLEKQITAMQNALQVAERRAAFVEDALRPEVGCSNAKAAYALAVAEDLFDRQGRPDWNALKAVAPELFRKPGPGNADGGAGGKQPPSLTMNDIIRRAAGRG
jgi:hypothetical protein